MIDSCFSLNLFEKGKKEMSKSALKRSRCLVFEIFERRDLLAGMPSLVAMPVVENLDIPALEILPGGENKVVVAFELTANRPYAQLKEMLFIPAMGSEPLSWNTESFRLQADMDGKKENGCEKTIAWGYANYENDVVDMSVYTPVWIRSQPLRVELVADFGSWQFSGEKFGVELAEADFRDLRNQPVPFENVQYVGVAPVIHELETTTLSVSQWWYEKGSTMVVYAGQENVSLLKFNTWGENSALTQVSFIPDQGNLNYGENYTLWFNDWNGKTAVVAKGKVSFSGKEISFDIQGWNLQNGYFDVQTDIRKDISDGSFLKLAFPVNGNGLAAVNLEDSTPLQGVGVNGIGEGQIQLSTSESPLIEIRALKDKVFGETDDFLLTMDI